MNPALWVAKTGLDAQQTRMTVVSNNLANVNTTGFKRDHAVFEDLLYQTVRQPGASASQDSLLPSGLNLGTGVRVVATEKLHSQGNVAQTENPLDMGIQGRGFFEVVLPDGSSAYTRDGSFQTNSQGQLVTATGLTVQPGINIPQGSTNLTVGNDGTVSVLAPGSNVATQIGSIQLVDFINPTGLQPRGENLFSETASSGSPQPSTPGLNGTGTVLQGWLETSNVNIVEELVNMIETQRAYEINSKAIETADGMMQYINNNL